MATRGAAAAAPRARSPTSIAACSRRPASISSSSRRRASARATRRSSPFVDLSLYVMTPEFGAAVAAREDRHARLRRRRGDQQVRAPRRRGRPPRRAPPARAQPRGVRRDVGGHAGVRHVARPRSTTTASPRSTSTCAACSPRTGWPWARAGCPAPTAGPRPRTPPSIPPGRARYLAEVAETVRGYHEATDRAGRRRARAPAPDARPASWSARPSTTPSSRPRRHSPAADADLLDGWAQTVEDYSGDELVVQIRDKELRTALTRESLSGSRIPRVALPRHTEDAELLRFLRAENLPGRFPFTAGVFPFKRDDEDPARMFAGEGDAFRTNRRFQVLSAGTDATRLSTAFDSVTLYGRDPDTRPDIYGKVGTSGVSIATLDDMEVLYGGFDLCAPSTSVSMTINGPAPDDPGVLPQHRDRPADRPVPRGRGARARPGRAGGDHRLRAGQRARHRAGRHPQGGPGPEHLHLLHRVLPADDGRHPGVVHRARGAQLLLGVDLRLPHRRGRGEPDQPARVHPRQRLHLRRELPRAGHGDRRLRAQPLVLLLQRHGRRVLRDRPGGAADLGGGDAGPLRRQRAQPEAQVPRADLRPVAARAGDELQRHPHHAAGAVRPLRQRELAAHQRLRRGGDHSDRGVRAPGDGHPADHQPGVGPRR